MIEDWKNGDYDLAVAGGMQMLSSLSMIFMKCFTGDTLVATEDGDKRIDEIAVGDSVWAEDTVTGEQVLKRVSKVYVKETDHLIHIGTSTGEDIETTENHPFYTEERGWVAASELEEGETLHTDDGDIVTVTYNHDEWLKEPVKVYNLEVEGLHTYYVTADRVLVHNQYSVLDDDALVVRGGQSSPDNLATNQAADSRGHISANSAIEVERAFSLAKRRYGLGLITAKLDTTTRSSIALSIIAMNVNHLTVVSFAQVLVSLFSRYKLVHRTVKYKQNKSYKDLVIC